MCLRVLLTPDIFIKSLSATGVVPLRPPTHPTLRGSLYLWSYSSWLPTNSPRQRQRSGWEPIYWPSSSPTASFPQQVDRNLNRHRNFTDPSAAHLPLPSQEPDPPGCLTSSTWREGVAHPTIPQLCAPAQGQFVQFQFKSALFIQCLLRRETVWRCFTETQRLTPNWRHAATWSLIRIFVQLARAFHCDLIAIPKQ